MTAGLYSKTLDALSPDFHVDSNKERRRSSPYHYRQYIHALVLTVCCQIDRYIGQRGGSYLCKLRWWHVTYFLLCLLDLLLLYQRACCFLSRKRSCTLSMILWVQNIHICINGLLFRKMLCQYSLRSVFSAQMWSRIFRLLTLGSEPCSVAFRASRNRPMSNCSCWSPYA